jgi:hypothetical protein
MTSSRHETGNADEQHGSLKATGASCCSEADSMKRSTHHASWLPQQHLKQQLLLLQLLQLLQPCHSHTPLLYCPHCWV